MPGRGCLVMLRSMSDTRRSRLNRSGLRALGLAAGAKCGTGRLDAVGGVVAGGQAQDGAGAAGIAGRAAHLSRAECTVIGLVVPECRERLRRAYEADRSSRVSDRLDGAIVARLAHAGIGYGAHLARELTAALKARDVRVAALALETGELPDPTPPEPLPPRSSRSSSPTLRLV